MSLPRLLRRISLVALSVVAAACSTDEITAPPEVPLETQVWATGLQVTLSQFTRLTSGVYLLDSVVGSGATLVGTPNIAVYYEGWLANGTRFDARTTGTPVCFPLGDLLGGWQIGLQGMKVEGKRRLLIPPGGGLGYGSRQNGAIPPNSNLLFDVTLKAIGCAA